MALEDQLVKKLKEKNLTITTAESCTAGLLAGTICNVSGVSAHYMEGYVTYSNEAKHRLLGVSEETLMKYGAVSEQTAYEMAVGVARTAGADTALVTTGIAGPDGGTAQKPVGLVYIGCFCQGKVVVKKCQFSGGRQEVRMAAVNAAMELLLEELG